MAAAKKLFAGDTRPTRLVYEVDKVPINITGYQFQLKIGYKTGTLVKNGVIVDAAAGKFEFQWAAAQGETPADLREGTHPAQMLVTDPDGKEQTHQIEGGIKIEARM